MKYVIFRKEYNNLCKIDDKDNLKYSDIMELINIKMILEQAEKEIKALQRYRDRIKKKIKITTIKENILRLKRRRRRIINEIDEKVKEKGELTTDEINYYMKELERFNQKIMNLEEMINYKIQIQKTILESAYRNIQENINNKNKKEEKEEEEKKKKEKEKK